MKILMTLLVSACATSAALAQTPAATPLTLERITADPPLAGRLPRQAEVSPGGQWVSFLRPSQADSEVLELWAQPAAGGEPRKLVAAADLLGGAAQKLSEAEKMALERQRITQRGITSYQWCGGDDGALLFPLSGDLYVVRLTASGPQAQKLALDSGAPKLEPRCAPDGRSLAYVQGGNLFTLPLAAGAKPRQLTHDGGATVTWGRAEFIAAEELSRQRGYWWSGDGKSLLALRVDESGVAVKTRAQIFADRTEMTQQRYPAAGEANAKVTAYVVDAASGQHRELALPKTAEYIARAGWFGDGTPWLQWFTRDQKRLTLTEFKPAGAGHAPRDITVETDSAWVEVHDDLIETPRGLLWSSEASGRRQLLLVNRASGARTPLTQATEPVAHAICANAQNVVYAAYGDLGKGQELYQMPLAGGRAQALPGAGSRQWRDAKADVGCARLLVTRSAWGSPPRLELRGLDGAERALALAGDPPDAALRQFTSTPLALELKAADGRTPLNAFFFPAQDRREGKHPVIVMAYGGPGAATVNWGWGRDMPLIAYWQQRGYGVLMLDTRGMAHRDREFTRAHSQAFGQVEVADLFAAVRQLPGTVPYVDAARIGFFGWSYGGFLGARAVLDADSPFAAAVAVAPVTDWTLYDTAYTERYLGLPHVEGSGGKAATYASANLPARAALLSKPLLLVHGTADDNVLFEHTLRLVEALQTAGKTFDLQIYPGKAHGIAGRAARLHLYRTMDAFFERHLRPGQ